MPRQGNDRSVWGGCQPPTKSFGSRVPEPTSRVPDEVLPTPPLCPEGRTIDLGITNRF